MQNNLELNKSITESERRKEYGKMVHRKRKKHSLSIEEMASYIGISQEAYARIEHGQVSPDIPSLFRRVMKALHQEKMVIK